MMIIIIAIDLVEVKPFKVKTLTLLLLGANLPCMAITGWTFFKQEQRRGYQLWASSSCTSGAE
jgi:hypothetical protein